MLKQNYAKYLKKGQDAVTIDQNIFEEYSDGKITLEQCFERWAEFNKPKFVYGEFKDFVEGMGYKQYKRK